MMKYFLIFLTIVGTNIGGYIVYFMHKYESIPLQYMFRTSPTKFNMHKINMLLKQSSGNTRGSLIGLVGMKRYFSGKPSRSFYIGDENHFYGNVLVQSLQQRIFRFKVIIFLNYSQVKFQTKTANQYYWQDTEFISDSIKNMGNIKFNIKLEGIKPGINDLQVLLIDMDFFKRINNLNDKMAEGHPIIFSTKTSSIVQIIRGENLSNGSDNLTSKNKPIKVEKISCTENNINIDLKNNKLGVSNCADTYKKGVFFFYNLGGVNKKKPIFYSINSSERKTFFLSDIDNSVQILHKEFPYKKLETKYGVQNYSHPVILGI